MSNKTWLEEFYPISAYKVSEEDALDHSIKKWEGALPENLAKHGIEKPPISFSSGSCALCSLHIDCDECSSCPLAIARGNVRCDDRRSDEEYSPYRAYHRIGDPKPMLKWLKEAKKIQRRSTTGE